MRRTVAIYWTSAMPHTAPKRKHHSSVIYAYAREGKDQRLLVVCSFTAKTAYFSAPYDYNLRGGELVLSNYDDAPLDGNAFFLRPYECRVYLWG